MCPVKTCRRRVLQDRKFPKTIKLVATGSQWFDSIGSPPCGSPAKCLEGLRSTPRPRPNTASCSFTQPSFTILKCRVHEYQGQPGCSQGNGPLQDEGHPPTSHRFCRQRNSTHGTLIERQHGEHCQFLAGHWLRPPKAVTPTWVRRGGFALPRLQGSRPSCVLALLDYGKCGQV
jgi:hypothetical protein